jgi:hypothetical protein
VPSAVPGDDVEGEVRTEHHAGERDGRDVAQSDDAEPRERECDGEASGR